MEGSITGVTTEALLFAGYGSGSERDTVTLFVMVPGRLAITTMVTVALLSGAIVPRSQLNMSPSFVQAPCEETADTKVPPAGRMLVSITAVADSGPVLVRLML